MMSFEKGPMKVQNLKPISLFVFFFALACGRNFIKAHSTESRSVIGQENILFAGVSPHHSAQKVLQAGAVKGLKKKTTRNTNYHSRKPIPLASLLGHPHMYPPVYATRLTYIPTSLLSSTRHTHTSFDLYTTLKPNKMATIVHSKTIRNG